MKKIMYSFLSFILLLSGCSGITVLDSWQGKNLSSIKDKNILVIARTDNPQARRAFEEAMANDLRGAGLKAVESYLKFPDVNHDSKREEESAKKEFKDLIERENFQGILISVVKDYNEAIVTEESGGYYAGASYGGYGGYGYYPGYYGGFYGYYHHPLSYSTYGSYVPSTTTTRVSKTYIVETLVYNLDQPEDQQLVGMTTTKVVDPSSLTKTAKNYSKAVFKSFKK